MKSRITMGYKSQFMKIKNSNHISRRKFRANHGSVKYPLQPSMMYTHMIIVQFIDITTNLSLILNTNTAHFTIDVSHTITYTHYMVRSHQTEQ